MMSFMSWFSNLFSNEVVSLAVSDQGVVKPEPYDAVRAKITNGGVTRQIEIINQLLIVLPISSKDRTKYLRSGELNYYGKASAFPHRKNVSDRLNLLARSLGVVDVQRSDMKTLFHVIDLCNSKLPAMLRELEIQIGQKDFSNESSILAEMTSALINILDEVAALPTTRSILNLETLHTVPDSKEFPDITSYKANDELYVALEILEKDWDKAAALPLSAEDDYVIERVGNSYLPDALLLFDRFSNRTGSTNSEKAISIVKEQVKLIHQQVLFVLEQHEEDSFDLMETHTEFLKMKNSRIGIPDVLEDKALQLGKLPPETPL